MLKDVGSSSILWTVGSVPTPFCSILNRHLFFCVFVFFFFTLDSLHPPVIDSKVESLS